MAQEERIAEPTVSVIIPIYDCAPYVGECIASLRAQTFADFEALCVDDGSTDGSLALAREAAAGDGRFSFDALPENRGQSAARNRALDQAHGEYLVLLDSDDKLVPEALERLVERARAQQLDDLYFSAHSFYESLEVHRLVREDFSQRTPFEGVASGLALFAFFEKRGEFFPQSALRLVRRDLVERNAIRFREGIIHEDVLFTFQTLAASERSSFLNEPLYLRRVRPGSTMTSPRRTIRNVRGHWACVTEIERWVASHAEGLVAEAMEAIAHQVSEWRLLMAWDWHNDLTDQEKREFLAELDAQGRYRFLTSVVYPGERIERMNREFYGSVTYRLGDAFLRLPRLVRDRISEARRFRKER